jgi:BirA family transcriptional regulator, biotin operon repressor / biotin---[acetyl-CoA-carboxylase] ligase
VTTGHTIHRYESLPSTMAAAAGLPPGSVVVAAEQTAGQGRHGHAWHSEKGAGLYCSIVLDLPEADPTVTLALGLAAVDAIAQVSGLGCDIRWPNDVMAVGRKLAGILVRATAGSVIAGIGINVNHAAFPPDIAEVATSLRIETGQAFDCEVLLVALLPAIDRECRILEKEGAAVTIARFAQASTWVRGKRVTVDGVTGTTAGLDPSGFLRLRKDDGTETVILAGGVREEKSLATDGHR